MKNYLRRYGIYYIVILLLSMCLYFVTLAYTNRGVIIVLLGLLALLMIGILPASTIYRMLKEDQTESWKKEQEKMNSIIRDAMNPNCEQDTKSKDILELMLFNMRDLREFYEISRRQAKNAFFLSVIMCIVGAILLLVSIASLLFLRKYTETLTIGMLGGTIVEVIAGTSLFVYKKALNQFNHYYRSLHENERFFLSYNILMRKIG